MSTAFLSAKEFLIRGSRYQLRSFKNFGHKKQPVPFFTFLWHGFLTFSFIGLGVEWKRIRRLIFGEDVERPVSSLE